MTTKKKAAPKAPPAPPKKKGRPKTEDVKFPHPGTTPMVEIIERAVAMLPPGAMIPDQKSRAYLRWFAGLFYSSDLNNVSIAQMSRHALFKDVGYDQLAKWSSIDGWADQRAALLARVQSQLQERVANDIVQKRVSELGKLKEVSQKLLSKLLPEPHDFKDHIVYTRQGDPMHVCEVCGHPKPGCGDPFWGVPGDKLVTALAKLMELMLQLEGIVLEKMTDVRLEGKKHEGDVPLEGALTDDEAREAAHAVLRRRNALASDEGEDDGGEDDDDDASDSPMESD